MLGYKTTFTYSNYKSGKIMFGVFNLSAYTPPRLAMFIYCQMYVDFFRLLGTRFLIGSEVNAKHPWWGSRTANFNEKQKKVANNLAFQLFSC